MQRQLPMTCLVLGATGATGRLLVRQLLDRGEDVRVLVRSPDALPEELRANPRLAVTAGSVLDIDDATFARQVEGCSAVASCLGHTLSMRGIFGPPRRLVADAIRRACEAIVATRPAAPVRFVLMNTAGVANRDLNERRPPIERAILSVLGVVLPPHADNGKATEYLRRTVGRNSPVIEWAAVRPDTLTDEEAVSGYSVHASPTRSALFNAGKTSRINVAHFMAELMTGGEVWQRWKGQMPVIYNEQA
jgi:nucleoside-diphosphate-sugar epimerase